jgi:hypothetical protein
MFLLGWLKIPPKRFFAGTIFCPVCDTHLSHNFLGNPKKPNDGKWECRSCGYRHAVKIINPEDFYVNHKVVGGVGGRLVPLRDAIYGTTDGKK